MTGRGKHTSEPRLSRTIACAICWLCLSPAWPAAQQTQPRADYFQFDPPVLIAAQTQSVILRVKVSGTPTRVAFELTANPQQPGREFDMHDDGTGGDLIAGDSIYAVTLTAAQLVPAIQTDDVHRPFVGFLNLYQATTVAFRGNVFAEVFDSGIPLLAVTNVAADVQYTLYVANIHDPAFFSSFDVTRVAKRFYQFFPDNFDFLNIVYTPGHFRNRYHAAVKNTVQGIGLSQFDNTATFGSAGRLLGYTVFPIPDFFDGAETSFQHELGHQWINFLRVPPLDSGIPHWPLSSLATGTMGWSDPITGQGLNFPCQLVPETGGIRLVPRTGEPVFADLDLYLMGFVAPQQVGEHIVFADQIQARSLPCVGQLFTGAVVRVNISAITGALGARVPDSSASPKQFKIATIIVSRDGLLNAEAMSFYSFFAKRAEEKNLVPFHSGFAKGTAKPFVVSTGGNGTLDAMLFGAAPDFSVTALPAQLTLNRGQSATYSVTVLAVGGSYDNSVFFSCSNLPAQSACSFSPASVTPGASAATSTLTITTTAPSALMFPHFDWPRGSTTYIVCAVLLGFWAIRPRLFRVRVAVGKQRRRLLYGLSLAVLALQLGCGGGTGTTTPPPPPPPNPGTPTGTFAVSIIATAGAVQRSTIVTLTVQ